MKKPNLFIVGSPKCGSTLLARELGKNRDIYVPKIKELNYFANNALREYKSYYKSLVIKDLSAYERMFDFRSKVKYFLDGSVSYFTFDDVPPKLFQYNDKAKIIICYRSPLERAISHYKMDLRMGYADKNFQNLISDAKSFYYRQYVENSLFYKNSKKFVDLFGIENVYFYSVSSNNNIELSKFLDINVEIDTQLKVNEAQIAKNRIGAFFLKNRHIATKIKNLIPASLLKFSKSLIYTEDNIQLDIKDFGKESLSQLVKDDWDEFNTIYIKNITNAK